VLGQPAERLPFRLQQLVPAVGRWGELPLGRGAVPQETGPPRRPQLLPAQAAELLIGAVEIGEGDFIEEGPHLPADRIVPGGSPGGFEPLPQEIARQGDFQGQPGLLVGPAEGLGHLRTPAGRQSTGLLRWPDTGRLLRAPVQSPPGEHGEDLYGSHRVGLLPSGLGAKPPGF
jgi:hypothetical protein